MPLSLRCVGHRKMSETLGAESRSAPGPSGPETQRSAFASHPDPQPVLETPLFLVCPLADHREFPQPDVGQTAL